MRVMMLATIGMIAAALMPAEAATSQANHVVLTWEMSHSNVARGLQSLSKCLCPSHDALLNKVKKQVAAHWCRSAGARETRLQCGPAVSA